MKFDPSDIRKKTFQDFDSTWMEGKKLIEKPSINNQYPRMKQVKFGKPHPIYDTISKLREAYMRMGFDEMMNPLIVDEKDVQKQFSHEALAVLDRCFYLSGLPRPNVGISDSKIESIRTIIGDIDGNDIDSIRNVLHSYKKGDIEGDDLIYEISSRLDISDSKVVEMIDGVFPEFKELKPEPSTKTLRSHMTSGWFISLGEMISRVKPPLQLFSIDRCFRREQQEDPSRLITYHSASCIIMDENLNLDIGKAVAEGLLSQFGFEKFKFKLDEKRSKYYIPDTQIEVFAYHPILEKGDSKYNDGWIEIATFGIYSPTALSMYDIPYPVMNLGLGVERLAMILHDSKDVRALSYPQVPKYSDWVMKDNEIAKLVSVDKIPNTSSGFEIMDSIIEMCEEKSNTESPCEFLAWEGTIDDKHVSVWVIEPEENTKLCGPAVFNEVVVYNNDILGLPRNKKWRKAFDNDSACTGIRFIDSFAARCAWDIEQAVVAGVQDVESRVRIVKVPSEINIVLDPLINKYITSHKKKIDLRGPVFTTVRAVIES